MKSTLLKVALFIVVLCSYLPPIFSKEQAPITTVLLGATIYPSPKNPSIKNGVVVIRDGKISAVGTTEEIKMPANATRIDCEGMFLTAGFQNSHVHFSEQKWENAAALSDSQVTTQLKEMLTRHGFTTVVDTGSQLENTNALRNRVKSGEVPGPRILTAGGPLYPENGIPYYLKDTLPPSILPLLATPKTPDEAAVVARQRLESGADIIKLFTGSWVKRGEVLPMKKEIASAAAAEAHRKGKLVFSHASNIHGLEAALEAGVDVIAHALDDDRGWNESHIERMKAKRMSMIPTLKLFAGPPYFKFILKEVGDFSRAGGQILFGTDVGYLTDYDPAQEYEHLGAAGLTWQQILASLTTAPAERFGESKNRGRIAAGFDADIVLLGADPAADVKNFSNVRYTIRSGNIIYRKD